MMIKGVIIISILIVGGDKLGKIKDNLKEGGATKIRHISGRKKGHLSIDFSNNLDMIIILTDFINHQMATLVKQRANQLGIKTVYAKRSWTHIKEVLR